MTKHLSAKAKKREYHREYMREYRRRPKVAAKLRKYQRKYNNSKPLSNGSLRPKMRWKLY